MLRCKPIVLENDYIYIIAKSFSQFGLTLVICGCFLFCAQRKGFYYCNLKGKTICEKKLSETLKDVRANCLCAIFLSISSKRSVRVRELRARKICHAKVCKQIWRPRRKVKKEVKVGDS